MPDACLLALGPSLTREVRVYEIVRDARGLRHYCYPERYRARCERDGGTFADEGAAVYDRTRWSACRAVSGRSDAARYERPIEHVAGRIELFEGHAQRCARRFAARIYSEGVNARSRTAGRLRQSSIRAVAGARQAHITRTGIFTALRIVAEFGLHLRQHHMLRRP